jgi:hypothetical protein
LSHRFLEQALEQPWGQRELEPLAWVQPGLVPLALELQELVQPEWVQRELEPLALELQVSEPLVSVLQALEPLASVLQALVLAYPAQVYPVQVSELVDLSLERA